jgi:hypothetical protein
VLPRKHEVTRHITWDAFSPEPEPHGCAVTLLVYSAPQRFLRRSDDGTGCVLLVPTPNEIKGDTAGWHPSATPYLRKRPQLFYRGTVLYNEEQRGKVLRMGARTDNRLWLNASAEPQPPDEAVEYRYLLDIGGISGTTWSALRGKLNSGSLVLRVDSGFADWWHSHLRADVHYVPVVSDLADLHLQYEFAAALPAAECAHRFAAVRALLNLTRRNGPLWNAHRQRVSRAILHRPSSVALVKYVWWSV